MREAKDLRDRVGGAEKTDETIAAVSLVYYSINFYNLSLINLSADILYKSHQRTRQSRIIDRTIK